MEMQLFNITFYFLGSRRAHSMIFAAGARRRDSFAAKTLTAIGFTRISRCQIQNTTLILPDSKTSLVLTD